jgi:hypothetical protein
MKRPKTEAEKAAFKAAMDKFVAALRPCSALRPGELVPMS